MTARRDKVAAQSQPVYTSTQVRTAYAKQQVPGWNRPCAVPACPTAPGSSLGRETLDLLSES
jgi:hypothetical protein